ncbi:hypothetical protein PO909_031415 [Leuciscus waleckii]
MAIADELKSKRMLHGEKYDEIKAGETDQDKMRKLFDSLKSGDEVKIAIYHLLEKHEPLLFENLGGVRRKRKLADPESPVPCKRLNTESNEQNNPHFNSASTSAPRPAPINNVTNIVTEKTPSVNMNNIAIMNKMEWKTPAPKKVNKTPEPKKVKTPASKKVNQTPAPKNVKTPTPKKVKTPASKKVNKTPTPKKVKTPASKKVNKTPAPKNVKTPKPKKVKTPAAKKVKTPKPKKVKTPAAKKVKTPKPKKVKTPAAKKVKRAAARK